MTTAAPAKTAYYFDEAAAQRAVDFFPRYLRHFKGKWAGQPLELLPWQESIVRDVFGWKRPDGTRKYRTVYIEVPRKNGKSTIAAGIALYLLTADGEQGAEIYSAAGDRTQAGIVFEVAQKMVETSPALLQRCDIFRSSIIRPSTSSSYRVLSSDVKTKHGFNSHGIIFDELHVQPNRELWDVLTTSTGARTQPLTFVITTAGYGRHSICWEQHDYAEKVLAGIIDDPQFYAVIFNAGSLDWRTPEAWRQANPSLGETITEEFLAAECQKAIETPGYQNTFRRLYLDEWTSQDSRWLDMGKWEACGEPFDPAILAGRVCYAGLDLSSVSDLTSLGLVFPPRGGLAMETDENGVGSIKPDQEVFVLSHFWVPEENITERERRDRVPYPLWAEQKDLEATEGNVVDYDLIRLRINALGKLYNIREIAIDRWNSTQLQVQLQGDGFTIVPFGQGFASMTAPTKELGKLVISGKLRHGGHPVLRWNASNVAISQDAAGNLKPDKAKSTERIDGVVAVIMGLGRAMVQGDGTSIYESQPLFVL